MDEVFKLLDVYKYTDAVLAALTFQSEDTAGCAYGLTSLRYPIGFKSYNTAALRKVYHDIDEAFRQVPEVSGFFFLFEGY